MNFKYTFIGCALFALLGCSKESTNISFSCEKDKTNDYTLKWEIYPEKENVKVKIYIADNDSVFPKSPHLTVRANDYIAAIKNENKSIRKFFRIKIDNTNSGIISNRLFAMDNIDNFRDMGGNFTTLNQQVRWGKIYRSGSLSKISQHDEDLLKQLNIKTVIDFRDQDVIDRFPNEFISENYFPISIESGSLYKVKKQIIEGEFLQGDIVVYFQDTYRDIIDNYSDKYATFFDILCDENNYPIVYHCLLGKDRTGLASYFLLKTLDIPIETIEKDYLDSNKYIDKFSVMHEAQYLPESMQEALTMLTVVDVAYLKYAIACMKKKSGSVEEYMAQELRITSEKKEKIKQILLYN